MYPACVLHVTFTAETGHLRNGCVSGMGICQLLSHHCTVQVCSACLTPSDHT